MAGRSNKRLNGSDGTAITAAMFALGVGWGDGTLVKTVTSGSRTDRGTLTITSVGSNQAQATATVTFTFPEAFASAPFIMTTTTNDNSLTAASAFANTTIAVGSVIWTHSIIPVVNKIYVLNWMICA
jgi:hypothetical protein